VAWDFLLAEKLGKTVAEIAAMPNVEYETWKDYIHVQHVLADLAARTEAHRAALR
jgi:hypothetical protein